MAANKEVGKTIFERVEDNQEKIIDKIDTLEVKAERKAEKKVMRQRITEMVRGMSLWEKIELTIKLWA